VVVYDLTVPHVPAAGANAVAAQLVVPDPTAVATLDTDRIQNRSTSGATSAFADAQWSDALPRLLQMKIIRSFEDANVFAGVGRPLEGLNADFQLLIDIRSFQMQASPSLAAEVEFTGKIVDKNGRIVATRIFRATAPADVASAPAAAAVLDRAFGKAAADLVPWVAQTIRDQPERIEAPRPVGPKKAARG